MMWCVSQYGCLTAHSHTKCQLQNRGNTENQITHHTPPKCDQTKPQVSVPTRHRVATDPCTDGPLHPPIAPRCALRLGPGSCAGQASCEPSQPRLAHPILLTLHPRLRRRHARRSLIRAAVRARALPNGVTRALHRGGAGRCGRSGCCRRDGRADGSCGSARSTPLLVVLLIAAELHRRIPAHAAPTERPCHGRRRDGRRRACEAAVVEDGARGRRRCE